MTRSGAAPGPAVNPRGSAEQAEAIVGDTFRNLVRQFSQELCFYRELVQNAIDAGSNRVDIDLEHDAARGVLVIRVADYGEGMDRAIIDTQLTRLFSSSKEDDFTKIGKFGIGFVSVFSVGPEAVVVDTGRAGESWRVIFQPNGRFERICLDHPVEGTQVRLFKRMAPADVAEFRTRSLKTIEHWCRHTSADIYFQGEPVNRPFGLHGRVRVRREVSGTEVVAALSSEGAPFFGFYNQGITLLEGQKEYVPGVAFKLNSRYLEHTLTRDDVRQDENYAKAMQILDRVVSEDLAREMLAALAAAAVSGPPETLDELWTLSTAQLLQGWDGSAAGVPLLPTLGGSPLAPGDLPAAAGSLQALLGRLGGTDPGPDLLYEFRRDALVEALAEARVPVLGSEGSGLRPLLGVLDNRGYRLLRAGSLLCFVRRLPADQVPPRLNAIARKAADILSRCGLRITSMDPARLVSSADDPPPFLVQGEPGPLALLTRRSLLREDALPVRWPFNLFGSAHVVLNEDHPVIGRLAALPERADPLPSYLLAKVMCLADGVHPRMDARLLEQAFGGGHGA